MNMRKHKHHERIRERARRALADLYHNATPSYPRLGDADGERFQAWFEDAAQVEIEYLRDGGAYGGNYRKTLESPANAGRYHSPAARAYYVAKGLRERDLERADCGGLTGYDVVDIAAGNKELARVLRKTFKKSPLIRHNAMWERIGDYGTLCQWGRGGRTLAPDDLVSRGGGSSFGIRKSYVDEMPIADVITLIRVVESFNRYVSSWCDSVPEQWAELERDRLREERAQRKQARNRNRAVKAMRERCETYVGG